MNRNSLKGQDNYYKILEIKTSATQKEIKMAYKRLIRKYHPDLSDIAGSTQKSQLINEAYNVLKHPSSKAIYDGKLGIKPEPQKPICPECGGILEFDLFSLTYECESCLHVFDLDDPRVRYRVRYNSVSEDDLPF